jgi:putative DNA primase/helicase
MMLSSEDRTQLEARLERATAVMKWALKSEAAARIEAMIRLARSRPGIPVTPDELDLDPWLLNCENGTIELRTGTLREHRREDFITRFCPVVYEPNASYPRWQQFLREIMDGNQSLIEYLQRAIGYSLTGSVAEQCLFFLNGTGSNGKSTFLGTILEMLGDYGMQSIAELLMVRNNEQHPTERADLFRKQFVATVDVESGKRLAESLVKQLTGGDRIRARRMREDFWQFEPTHKLWLAANHKPLIRGQDHAVWRRIRLIPFTVKIPDDRKDKHLPAKLKAELPGILAWAVQGCLEWQRIGLDEPKAVTDATDNYQAEMDTIGQILSECCTIHRERDYVKTKSGVLLGAFCRWSGDRPTPYWFSARLEEKGFESCRSNDGVYWRGIGLLADADDEHS